MESILLAVNKLASGHVTIGSAALQLEITLETWNWDPPEWRKVGKNTQMWKMVVEPECRKALEIGKGVAATWNI